MSDHSFSEFEAQQEPGDGPRLPGGISMQAAATGLLVVVLLAILWIFFGPTPDEGPSGLPTATAAAAGATPSVAAGTVVIGDATQAATGAAATPGTTPVVVNATPPFGGMPTAAAGGVTPATIPTVAAGGTTVPAAGLAEGVFVQITNTDALGIRLRFSPGLDSNTIRIAEEGEVMRVGGGPETGDGLAWWRLQDAFGNVGWAAEEYLVPTTAPASWNPPVASPTFEAGAAEG